MSNSRVYVGRLDSDVNENDLYKFFEDYGKINSILLKRGYAFVEFSDPLDADDAVFCLNRKMLLGKRVNLELAHGLQRDESRYAGPSRKQNTWIEKYGPILRTEHQLIVDNLSSRVSWQDLKDLMRNSGSQVTYANAHNEKRNMGYVEFATHEDMMKAYDKWNNTELQGRRINLIINKDAQRKRRSRSRSGSRSSSYRGKRRKSERYSRSRSRSSRRSWSRSSPGRNNHSRSKSRSRDEKSSSREIKKEEERSRSRSVISVAGSRSRSRSVISTDGSRSRSRSVISTDGSRSRSRSRSVVDESRSRSPDNRD